MPAADIRADGSASILQFPRPPKTLAQLRWLECRYCVAEAPKGEMDRALFCAAPCVEGPYCDVHAQRCLQPIEFDLEALAAEIEAACEPR
jgi:hypothetical protein